MNLMASWNPISHVALLFLKAYSWIAGEKQVHKSRQDTV